ncbi:MAG: hypothetical protein KAS32_24660 [Candidatus Peribacteraceae bacterium]|nr:hypothetical protein [Candidatus Peribacteraceae bacterium]
MLKKRRIEEDRRLKQVVKKAQDRLELEIVRHIKKENFITAAFVRDNLYKNMRIAYVDLQADVDKWGQGAVKRTAKEWRRLAINDLPRGSYDQTFAQFDKKYLRDIIAEFSPNNPERLAAVNKAIGGMLQNDVRVLRAALADVQRLGAATGMSTDQMRKELTTRVLRVRPGFQFVDSAGRTWQTDTYFKMLAKTTTNNTANQTYVDVATEAGHDLVTFEGGASTVGDSCDQWVGRIVSISGNSRKFPAMSEATGSSHMLGPNCNHYVAVVLDQVEGELERAMEEEEEIRGEINQLDRFRKQAVSAGVPKGKAHEVIERAAKAQGVSPFKVSQEDFNKQLAKDKPKKKAA